jgi:hypothetical protein
MSASQPKISAQRGKKPRNQAFWPVLQSTIRRMLSEVQKSVNQIVNHPTGNELYGATFLNKGKEGAESHPLISTISGAGSLELSL